MRAARLALTLLLAVSPALAGEKSMPEIKPLVAPPAPFSDMMMDVQRLQARMARGDRQAYGESRARMKAVGAAIAASGPDAFKTRAERDAVVVYLLSGGQPKDVAKLAERGDFPPAEQDLLIGAAGYTLGREGDAEKLLHYDAKAQSLRLASQLAYAQSVLLTPKDAEKSLALLDLARLLAPGTLIEEASLRREILLVGDLRQPERVGFLARQYVERFANSLYAGDFVRSLAATAIRFDLCATLADLDKFSALLQVTPPEQSRAFLLTVARASLLLGRFDVAGAAADRARKVTDAGTPDAARANLYLLLARFTAMPEDEGRSAFSKIALDKLTPADRDLFDAAASVEERLFETPPRAAYEETWREAAIAQARSPELPQDDSPAATTIRRAVAALEAGEALGVKEGSP